MVGYKIGRDVFSSLICIDGRMEKMSQDERDFFVKTLYQNTLKLIKLGVPIPVKLGHNDSDELLKGVTIDLKVKFKKNPTPHYTIWAEMLLDDSLFTAYKAGKLPSTSIEIGAKGANIQAYTGIVEDTVGPYIQAVSLDGTTPVAMPYLEKDEVTSDEQYMMNYTISEQSITFALQEYKSMNDKIKSFMNAMSELAAKHFGGDDAPDDKGDKSKKMPDILPDTDKDGMKKMEASPSPAPTPSPLMGQGAGADEVPTALKAKDDEISQLKAKLAKYESDPGDEEVDKQFSRLCGEGFVLPEERDKVKTQFAAVAKANGLGLALEVFGKTKKTPTSMVQTPPNDVGKFDNKRLRSHYKALGMKDAEIDKAFEHMKKNNMATIQGGE